MALHSDINQALTNLGGYKKVVTRGHENENIKITIKFRSFSKGEDKSPLVTYILEIKPDHNDGGIIEQEILEYRRGSRGKPWRFIEFKSGKGNVVINEDEYENLQSEVKREEDELENNYTMALKRFAGIQWATKENLLLQKYQMEQ
ncbi:hypothetical protein CHS0354_023990 [Potamilus streckersoni]|uniref:Uncharacterized protein n=1 Tax=Potamilus streckersoni TaxID=2493646 RepID=A0AAE0RZG4_9BIVA|nr:hypothetical protein CHS0354_023990 [Potamilus streckersoni]